VLVFQEIFDLLDGYLLVSIDVDRGIYSRRNSIAHLSDGLVVRQHALRRLVFLLHFLDVLLAPVFGVHFARLHLQQFNS
jgi:hypothetical protein